MLDDRWPLKPGRIHSHQSKEYRDPNSHVWWIRHTGAEEISYLSTAWDAVDDGRNPSGVMYFGAGPQNFRWLFAAKDYENETP